MFNKRLRWFDGTFGMGCSPSILSSLSNNHNRKDSGLYCSNNSDTNSNVKIDIHDDSNTSKALANQILVQSASKDVIDKVKNNYLDPLHVRLMANYASGWTQKRINVQHYILIFYFRRITWKRIRSCQSAASAKSATTSPSCHRQ